jgi:hypothetical protein
MEHQQPKPRSKSFNQRLALPIRNRTHGAHPIRRRIDISKQKTAQSKEEEEDKHRVA